MKDDFCTDLVRRYALRRIFFTVTFSSSPCKPGLLFVGVWHALAQIIWRDLNQLRRPPLISLGGYLMSYANRLLTFAMLAGLAAVCSTSTGAQEVETVFVIAMENHNWTQPANQFTGGIQQFYLNPNAPFLNALVNGTAVEIVDGSEVNISSQVSCATAYHNVLATTNGNNPHIHPSEPNYIWAEAGTNFGVLNDNVPYTGGTNQNTSLHLSNLLTRAGKTWKSYQEDIDLTRNGAGQLTNVTLPRFDWTVPLSSFSGVFAAGTMNQFNADDTVADYNWITPNQFNDMHTTLSAGYKGLTGDPAKISQGDDFLRKIVPVITASNAYKNHGVVFIWFDESESDGVAGDNPDDFNHTIGEMIISPRSQERRRPSLRQFGELHAFFRSAHLAEYLSRGAVPR
jgi:phosphatidylinositol-3-phosphatase